MTTVNIYLTFEGDCMQAFEFYRSIFGGEFSYVGKFSDMPPQEGQDPSTNDKAGFELMFGNTRAVKIFGSFGRRFKTSVVKQLFSQANLKMW